jgi:hypothetical protein
MTPFTQGIDPLYLPSGIKTLEKMAFMILAEFVAFPLARG